MSKTKNQPLTKEQISSMNREELICLRDALAAEIRTIKNQIEDYKFDYWGKANVPKEKTDWYKSAKWALLKKTESHTAVNLQLSLIKENKRRSVEWHFVEVCREELPTEVFRNLMNQANENAGRGE